MSTSISSVGDIHPGVLVALRRLSMDELDIAQAMADGDLTSPQDYENVTLFDIRITGTGVAWRDAHQEYAVRDRELYLNDRFLKRCNGLPVIWEHPAKSMLNSKEFENRIVGTVFLPYIRDEEVWAVVKMYDAAAIATMRDRITSTSPGVVLSDRDTSSFKTQDGDSILVEGKPRVVDHIAICPLGVWDKGGEARGVRNDSVERNDMAGENIDNDLRHLLDAIKKGMDDTNKRLDAMDAKIMRDKKDDDARRRRDAHRFTDRRDDDDDDSFAKRRDAEEKELCDAMAECGEPEDDAKRKAKDARKRRDDDDRRRDDAKRRDGDARKKADDAKKRADDDAKRRDEEHAEWEKEDAAQCARDDAEEEAEKKVHAEEGDPEPVAADKARRSRRDRMKGRRDLMDAVTRFHQSDSDPKERETLGQAQHRADSAYSAWGDQAPAPMRGERPTDYRLRLLRPMQKHSADWKDVDLSGLGDAALGIAERIIYNDAATASRDPGNYPEDAIHYRTRMDPNTGHRITEGFGQHTFIRELKRPSMRVTRFMTERRA